MVGSSGNCELRKVQIALLIVDSPRVCSRHYVQASRISFHFISIILATDLWSKRIQAWIFERYRLRDYWKINNNNNLKIYLYNLSTLGSFLFIQSLYFYSSLFLIYPSLSAAVPVNPPSLTVYFLILFFYSS